MNKTRHRMYKRSIEERSRNYCYRGKAISITYFECVSVVLVVQHAMCMRLIILLSVTCLAVPYFSKFLINSTIFLKKLQTIKCVLWFSLQLSSEVSVTLRRIHREKSSCKLTVVLVRVCGNLNICDRFSKNIQISNFMKIRPPRPELFHADEQTWLR
jgi:hypothetical protein